MEQNYVTPPEKHSNKKPIFIAGIATAVILAGSISAYGFYAASNGMWPFSQKEIVTDQVPAKKQIKEQVDTEPVYTKVEQGAVLNVRPAFETTSQGDCVMTVSGNGQKLEFKNSTRGLTGVFGCLEFNADASTLSPGTYKVIVTFSGDSETGTITDTVNVQ